MYNGSIAGPALGCLEIVAFETIKYKKVNGSQQLNSQLKGQISEALTITAKGLQTSRQ